MNLRKIIGAGLSTLLVASVERHAWAGESPAKAVIAAQAQQVLSSAALADAPGLVVLVARGDQVVYRGARGFAQVELAVPLKPEQLFRIGSNTKQFTAAAVLKLADQHRLSLDDPLSQFLPDYPNGQHITIHQLLNHTSGIKDYTEIDGYFEARVRQDVDTTALLAAFKDLPPDFAPGSDWKYDNSGYVVLGAVLERLTSKSWHAAVSELLLAPLSLAHTTYDDQQVPVPGRASGYSLDAQGQVMDAPFLSMSQAAAAGGLLSTADDLLRWMRALHTGKVLSAENYRRMVTPAPTSSGQPADYAYGLSTVKIRGESALEGDGRIPGFLSVTLYLPQPAISVVVLANIDRPNVDLSVVATKLAAMALGRPYRLRHPVQLTAAQLQMLVGTYQRGANGRRTVFLRDGALYTDRDGGSPHRLRTASVDELYFDEVLDYFKVVRDPAGSVTALEEFPDEDSPGMKEAKMTPASGDRGN